MLPFTIRQRCGYDGMPPVGYADNPLLEALIMQGVTKRAPLDRGAVTRSVTEGSSVYLIRFLMV